jgi:arsenite methyltransferase
MSIQVQELRGFIADMYGDVARFPRAEFHFPIGRPIMESLGYPREILDRIPETALQSFAGVGYHFGLAPLREGEHVLDIGSGAGSDVFFAALQVGPLGRVVGLDMTDAMIDKARSNAEGFGLDNSRFEKGYAEELPFANASFDCVISNGVINLAPDKPAVLEGIERVLKPGGRLMLSDIVTGIDLPESLRDNCELWAECIGGAEQEQRYLRLFELAGLTVEDVSRNDYRFTQASTISAAEKFQVRSISVLATKGAT